MCRSSSSGRARRAVIPYVCDQPAMARLSRATFSPMPALLSATAAVVGALVLRRFPQPTELTGIARVVGAMAVHRIQAAVTTG
jgi:inner membrane transporter RhtA